MEQRVKIHFLNDPPHFIVFTNLIANQVASTQDGAVFVSATT